MPIIRDKKMVIDDSCSVNAPVVKMMIISDATTWSITYNHHSDNQNIFIILPQIAGPPLKDRPRIKTL